ncbi:MAG: imidazolonepropionase-like amidohydrolase [Planctomycetota bacterium]|jgi:imidazolonepropionase-like amidohydrolase
MRLKATWLARLSLACAVIFPSVGFAGTIPQPKGVSFSDVSEVFVIRAEQLIVRPGDVRENVSVLVENGKIRQIANEIPLPEGATEVKGKVVCASFIDAWSALGIEEQVLSDTTMPESGRTADGLDLYSGDNLRDEALSAGVTSARLQAGWRGKSCGVGTLLRLDPQVDNPEEAVLLKDCDLGMSVGLSVARGGSFQRMPDGSVRVLTGDQAMDIFDRVGAVESVASSISSGKSYREAEVEYKFELEEWNKGIAKQQAKSEKDFKKAKKARDKKVKKAEEDEKEVKEEKYKEDKKPRKPKYSEDKEVLAMVAEGEMPLVIEVHRSSEIRNLLANTEGFSRLRLVIAGGSEALGSAKELAKRDIPVIVWPSLRGTQANDEFSGADLSLAAELSAAGVKVLLGTGGRDASATRDLPLLAQLAIGHGFDRDLAFEALTTGAARTFDVSDRVGSVETGKDADILVLDGMPLKAGTNIQYVFCGGRLVVSPEGN